MNNALITLMILALANDGGAPAAPEAAVESESGSAIYFDSVVASRWISPPRTTGPLPVDADELRARLGSRRSRELREANFHVRRFELNPVRDLSDDPIAQERVEEILLDGFVKLLRVSVENALDLDRRVERLRPRALADSGDEESPARRGFKVSPNLWVGDDLAYGFKVRPRTAHPVWSRTQLEMRQYTDSESLLVRFKYAHGDRLFMLEHRQDDRVFGDSFGLLMRTSF